MDLTAEKITKIAQLAQLRLTPQEQDEHGAQITRALELISSMHQVSVAPLDYNSPIGNPMLRSDEVTEFNQRELFQKLAPETKMGLYIVPKVIEEE